MFDKQRLWLIHVRFVLYARFFMEQRFCRICKTRISPYMPDCYRCGFVYCMECANWHHAKHNSEIDYALSD